MAATLHGLTIAAFLLVASAAPPANDNFEHAASLGQPPAIVTGTLDDATRQVGEPDHGDPTVWYAFRPSTSRRVAAEMPWSNIEGGLSVYTGPVLASLRSVGSSLASRVPFDAIAGETYWIAVASRYGEVTESRFELRIRTAPLPANDDFRDAKRLRTGRQYTGSVADATPELGEPPHILDGPFHSVWFRFRAPRTGRVTIDTGGSSVFTILAAYRGNELSKLRLVAKDYDFSSPSQDGGSTIRFIARRGRTYRIAVDADSSPPTSPSDNPVGFGDYALWLSDGSIKGKGITLDVDSGQTMHSVRSRGLRAVVGARRRATIGLQLLVNGRTARRLGLARVIGSVRGVVGYNRQLTAVIRLTSAARRALRDRPRLTATLRLTILKSTAPNRVLARRVRLRG